MRLLLKRRRLIKAALALGPATAQAAAQRLVSVGGAITETLYRLGVQDRLVGVDSTSLFPLEAQRLPGVGYARSLSAEGLLALRPSLVLATAEAGPPAVLQQLRAAGLRLELLELPHHIEGVLARTRRLGELTDRRASAEALALEIHAAWQQALPRVSGRPPRVLFVLAHAPGQARLAGRDTVADAMIRAAGARNAFAEVSGYKPINAEAVLAAQPDWILSTAQGLAAVGGLEGLARQPGLGQTQALRAGRVLAPDALQLLGFGPRAPQALAELVQAFHRAA